MKYKFTRYDFIPEKIQNYVVMNYDWKKHIDGSKFGAMRGRIKEIPLEEVNRLANQREEELNAADAAQLDLL